MKRKARGDGKRPAQPGAPFGRWTLRDKPRSTGYLYVSDVSDPKGVFMQFAVTVVAFAACVASFSAQAAGAPNESFARDMMTCAFKHITFAFGPGNASVAENAAVEAQAYLTAAIEASNEDFVEKESDILKPQAQAAVLAAMDGAKNVAGIVAVWTDTKARCDQQLASFASAGDR